MAGVSKIAVFLRSSDFLIGHPDYEYGSNVKKNGWMWLVDESRVDQILRGSTHKRLSRGVKKWRE